MSVVSEHLQTKIVLKRTTEELSVNPPHKVHVEHIYAQKPDEKHRTENHAQIVNRLGKLTLLDRVLNMTIKNASFAKKKLF